MQSEWRRSSHVHINLLDVPGREEMKKREMKSEKVGKHGERAGGKEN